jgi:hypothetical protein
LLTLPQTPHWLQEVASLQGSSSLGSDHCVWCQPHPTSPLCLSVLLPGWHKYPLTHCQPLPAPFFPPEGLPLPFHLTSSFLFLLHLSQEVFSDLAPASTPAGSGIFSSDLPECPIIAAPSRLLAPQRQVSATKRITPEDAGLWHKIGA